MTATPLRPTRDRQLGLDVLRGFALFGILLVNFDWFTRAMGEFYLGPRPDLVGADRAVDWIIYWLAVGKFYPLFSILFGAGFALMWQRAQATDAAFWGTWLRRLLVLGLIGAAHVSLIWAGDILLTYAIAGFLMVGLFGRTPTRRLIPWSLALILLPPLFGLLGGWAIHWLANQPDLGADLTAEFAALRSELAVLVEANRGLYQSGSFAQVSALRWREWLEIASYAVWYLPPIVGYFLLGRWLLASGRLTDLAAHDAWLRRWRALGLASGLAVTALALWLSYAEDWLIPSPGVSTGVLLLSAGALLLTLGYLCTVLLAQERLRWLAPAGQMALSNYLLQSAVWTWVFYGYGLGLWGQVPRALAPLLVTGFFAVQVGLSHWWLKRFRFGPAEWLWRTLSYGAIQPMRR